MDERGDWRQSVVTVKLYVEGGGRTELNSKLRRAFHNLLSSAGFAGRMPAVVACGSRDRAFDRFQTALKEGIVEPILLVDSEDLVTHQHMTHSPSGAWEHLNSRDNWIRPRNAQDDQAQLMVTTMETWLIADRDALAKFFPGLNENQLPAPHSPEERGKEDVLAGLTSATSASSKGRYNKGRHSFELLGMVNPEELKRQLPHFKRFLDALGTRLGAA